jgi:hypothetical protein
MGRSAALTALALGVLRRHGKRPLDRHCHAIPPAAGGAACGFIGSGRHDSGAPSETMPFFDACDAKTERMAMGMGPSRPFLATPTRFLAKARA